MNFLDFRHKKWANLGLFKALKTKFWILLWGIIFCHVSTFLKMFDINQYPAYIKKFVKCNLRPISYLPPSATNCQYLFHNVWWHNKQNGHEIDPQQVTAIFFFREKLDPEIPGKIRMLNSKHLRSDLKNWQQNILFCAEFSKLVFHFHWFWHFCQSYF